MTPACLTSRAQFQALCSLASTHPQGGSICGDSRPWEVNHPSLALDFLSHATSQERSSHPLYPGIDSSSLSRKTTIQPKKLRTGLVPSLGLRTIIFPKKAAYPLPPSPHRHFPKARGTYPTITITKSSKFHPFLT